jgi:electron transfer flavoprotein-quinone oxidoreductase
MRRAPRLVLSERIQQRYPALICGIAQDLFTVANPAPKPGLARLVRTHRRRARVGYGELARDAITTWRTFG